VTINLSGLRAFHAVAQAGSFTRAARARNVSQPTLSAQVLALEAAYGVKMFDRIGRSVRLTPLGQSLFVIAARLFAAEDEAEALLAGTRTLTRGHLRVAADGADLIMPALAVIRERFPGMTFALAIDNSANVLRQVLDYAADVAITATQTSDPRIASFRLVADVLTGFVPAPHAWAKRKAVPIEAFAGQDIVLRERGSITREVFEARLAEAGVKPGHLMEVQTREAVGAAVAAGFGVGIIFGGEFRAGPGLHRLAITGADLAVAEYAVCLEERRRIPVVRSFLDALGVTSGKAVA